VKITLGTNTKLFPSLQPLREQGKQRKEQERFLVDKQERWIVEGDKL